MENKVFETDYEVLCHTGFHFCLNPLHVFRYYPLLDGYCNMPELAEVESYEDDMTWGEDDATKVCTKRIKIGSKMSLTDFVKHGIRKCKQTENRIRLSGEDAWAHCGDQNIIVTEGDFSNFAENGWGNIIVNKGANNYIMSSGNLAQIVSSHTGNTIMASGSEPQIISLGDDPCISTSGRSAQIVSLGAYAQITSSGWRTKIVSYGDNAEVVVGGSFSKVVLYGKEGVCTNIGIKGMVKGVKGSKITLAEHDDVGNLITVKSFEVDGQCFEENTFYKLYNGEITKCDEPK